MNQGGSKRRNVSAMAEARGTGWTSAVRVPVLKLPDLTGSADSQTITCETRMEYKLFITTVKTRILNLAVDRETQRLLHGDDHAKVIEVDIEIYKLKKLLATKNMFNYSCNEHQIKTIKAAARKRAGL